MGNLFVRLVGGFVVKMCTKFYICDVVMVLWLFVGELPYPGLCWDFAFPTRLERGLRLEEPMYNDQPWM